jgi:hypothetical protein
MTALRDASQIDTSQYTHIHFGFGTLTPSFEVQTGDAMSSYECGEFKRISGVKKILSLGGWDFSTIPDTYQIFRNGVKPENRLAMAQKIATFIKDNTLTASTLTGNTPVLPISQTTIRELKKTVLITSLSLWFSRIYCLANPSPSLRLPPTGV